MTQVKLPGVQLAYDAGGEGPAVTFLHGFTQSRLMWEEVIERLPMRWRLVRPDLRGHGETRVDPGGAYTMDACLDDLDALWQRLGIDRTHLVGAYALGKAQRIIRLLREAGYGKTLYMHGAMDSMNALYQAHGIELGPLAPATDAAKNALPGEIGLELLYKRLTWKLLDAARHLKGQQRAHQIAAPQAGPFRAWGGG